MTVLTVSCNSNVLVFLFMLSLVLLFVVSQYQYLFARSQTASLPTEVGPLHLQLAGWSYRSVAHRTRLSYCQSFCAYLTLLTGPLRYILYLLVIPANSTCDIYFTSHWQILYSLLVYLSSPKPKIISNCVDWRLLVEEYIPKISKLQGESSFLPPLKS